MKKMSIIGIAALLICLLLAPLVALTHVGLTPAWAAWQTKPQPIEWYHKPQNVQADEARWDSFARDQLTHLSSGLMMTIAKKLGITEVYGKSITKGSTPGGKVKATVIDIPVANNPLADESSPSIAVNPVDPRELYAILEDTSDAFGCSVYYSNNAGATWALQGALPPSPNGFGADVCYHPSARWSPDGLMAYLAYGSVDWATHGSDIVVTQALPAAVGGPGYGAGVNQVFFAGAAGVDLWDAPWVDVHQVDLGQANWVYVTATYFDFTTGQNWIAFDVSNDQALTWFGGGVAALPLSSLAPFPFPVQWSRPIGGISADVLVCWFNAEIDGWNNGPWNAGFFDIRCRQGVFNGLLWWPEVTAANNVNYELPFWLGPGGAYHWWEHSEGPSLAISPDGRAHIVFTRDPTVSRVDSECGNVVYVRSNGPFPFFYFTTPAVPVTVGNYGVMAQGFPTIAVQLQRPIAPTPLGYRLFLFYIDHRFSPSTIANIYYDVYERHSDNGGVSWTAPARITDVSSISELISIGGYTDSSAAPLRGRAWVIWTDRGDKWSILDLEDDVWADYL